LRLGVRTKVFGIVVGLTAVVAAVTVLFLEPRLAGFLEARLGRELLRDAQAARGTLELAPELGEGESAQRWVAQLGRATSARVTLISREGRVVADSEVAPELLPTLENHASRPEVRDAMGNGTGVSERSSVTRHQDMIYVAVRFDGRDGPGVVRMSLPTREVAEELRRLRILLLAAGVVGLLTAMIAGAVAAQGVARALQRVLLRARALMPAGTATGAEASDELGFIVGSLNRVADDLNTTMSTLDGERRRSAALLESMSEAVLALDSAGRVTLANPAAIELLRVGGSPNTVIGRTLLETVRLPALLELATKAASVESGSELELPGGQPRRVQVRGRPLADGSGTVLVMHDVTELRRLETVRRDFVANVSHELRTPVSVIRANAETLLSGGLEDRARSRGFVDGIWRNAERLSALLADLLDIARIEAGQYRLEQREVPVARVLASAVETYEAKARAKRIDLTAQPAGALAVLGDESALTQVVSNFVDNAVKYTPEGGKVALEARLEPQRDLVRLTVADDGPGIEPRHRARIFERFYRVDPGRSREMGGTGLGLAIAKHLSESMGGEVGVGPASPHGSVFWVSLPRFLGSSPSAPPTT
jgi:two-component system phosphate regulon sensor histidine kinase PhoR